ncbi:MAG: Fic family protein [Candidatus Dormiibacterota bacterium]
MEHNSSRRGRPSRQLVFQRLEEAMTELRQRLGGLPSPAEAEGIWTSIWYQEAHHSTALEGNTLVIKQVEALLAEGRAVGNKELSQYLEVTGYAAAAQWVYGHALNSGGWAADTPLTLTEVRHVHELALGPVWGVAPHPNALPGEGPGGFREHDIEPFPGGMVPPSWVRIQAAMTDWTASLSAARSSANPVESLAAAHSAFERIHPFLDGNGRTGRLLINLLLVRSGYPPAIVYTRDRNRYLMALRRADAGDPGPLGELIARAVTDNLYRFVVPAVTGPNHLVPLASLASKEHSLVGLRVAIERGRLKGQRNPDGQWRSTRVWLAEYLASRYRRSALQAILDAEPMSVPAPGPLRQELGQIRSRSDRPPNHPRLGPGG